MKCCCLFVLTSFLCFNSSLLKLLRSKAKNKLSTIKFPTTRAGMKIARQEPGLPCDVTLTSDHWARTQQLLQIWSELACSPTVVLSTPRTIFGRSSWRNGKNRWNSIWNISNLSWLLDFNSFFLSPTWGSDQDKSFQSCNPSQKAACPEQQRCKWRWAGWRWGFPGPRE